MKNARKHLRISCYWLRAVTTVIVACLSWIPNASAGEPDSDGNMVKINFKYARPLRYKFSHEYYRTTGEEPQYGGRTEATLDVNCESEDREGALLIVRASDVKVPDKIKGLKPGAFEFKVRITKSGKVASVEVPPEVLAPDDGASALRAGLIQQMVLTCFIEVPPRKLIVGELWNASLTSAKAFVGPTSRAMGRGMIEEELKCSVADSKSAKGPVTIIGGADVRGRQHRIVAEVETEQGTLIYATRTVSFSEGEGDSQATRLVNIFRVYRPEPEHDH